MDSGFMKMLQGYQAFRDKYVHGDKYILQYLSYYGQQPEVMMVSCCDSRVDPALIMQCDPGDLFVVRNVANIVPPYEKDDLHHGTSAALEFAVCHLKVKHLIIMGHRQCGGIKALLNAGSTGKNDFISNWVSIIKVPDVSPDEVDTCAKLALHQSRENCLTFPWIKERVDRGELIIHLWFFDIKQGLIFFYSEEKKDYLPLDLGD